MKPSTAAAKLGIYLPAAPPEFQTSPITRDDLDAMRADLAGRAAAQRAVPEGCHSAEAGGFALGARTGWPHGGPHRRSDRWADRRSAGLAGPRARDLPRRGGRERTAEGGARRV